MAELVSVKNTEMVSATFKTFKEQIKEFKEKNDGLVFDVDTKKGEKALRSHVATMRRSKKPITEAKAAAKKESLNYGRMLDAEEKKLIGEIDEMIEKANGPLLEIKARQDYAQDWNDAHDHNELVNRELEIARKEAELKKQEEERLAIIEAERLEKERIEREERIMVEAEEKARKEAEKKAEDKRLAAEKKAKFDREEAERAAKYSSDWVEAHAMHETWLAKKAREESERKAKEAEEAKVKAEKEAQEAEARRIKAEKDRIENERIAKEQTEINRVAAEKKAEREKQEAIKREQDRAARAESDRVAAEKAEFARIAEEKRLREADLKHRGKINRTALDAMVAQGITVEDGKKIIGAIANGLIPAIEIKY